MNFKGSLSEFQKLLQRVIPAIPAKSTLPVLEHLLFSLKDGTLTVTATDQEIIIVSSINVEIAEEGTMLVPARKVFDIIKALEPQGEFVFTASLETHEIKIKTAKGNYNMKGLDVELYVDLELLYDSKKPNIEEIDPNDEDALPVAVFHERDIQRLASKTFFAVSTDEFRPAMTGVFFQFRKNYVNSVATDSFRLSRATCFSEKYEYPDDFDVIFTVKFIDFLKKIDSEVIMSFLESNGKITHVRCDYGSSVLISKVINEKFPPYESVIPVNNPFIVLVDQKQLIHAIKRVSIFANAISKQVKMIIENGIINLLAEDEESGYLGNEEIPCDYNEQKLEFAFNFKYLEELVNNIDSDETEEGLIKLLFGEANRPVLLKPKNQKDLLLMLIMPVRNQN